MLIRDPPLDLLLPSRVRPKKALDQNLEAPLRDPRIDRRDLPGAYVGGRAGHRGLRMEHPRRERMPMRASLSEIVGGVEVEPTAVRGTRLGLGRRKGGLTSLERPPRVAQIALPSCDA